MRKRSKDGKEKLKTIRSILAIAVLQVPSAATIAAAEIPYPAALEAAAVQGKGISAHNREALAIGNGDLNAVLREREGSLCLRVAKARLSMPEAVSDLRDYYKPLAQPNGLFCWPKDKDACFTRLRAEGGFLVTARQKGGNVVKLEITSTVGGKLRVLNPWTDNIVDRDTAPGETVKLSPDNLRQSKGA